MLGSITGIERCSCWSFSSGIWLVSARRCNRPFSSPASGGLPVKFAGQEEPNRFFVVCEWSSHILDAGVAGERIFCRSAPGGQFRARKPGRPPARSGAAARAGRKRTGCWFGSAARPAVSTTRALIWLTSENRSWMVWTQWVGKPGVASGAGASTAFEGAGASPLSRRSTSWRVKRHCCSDLDAFEAAVLQHAVDRNAIYF